MLLQDFPGLRTGPYLTSSFISSFPKNSRGPEVIGQEGVVKKTSNNIKSRLSRGELRNGKGRQPRGRQLGGARR